MTSGWKLVLRSIAIILAAVLVLVGWDVVVALGILLLHPSWIHDERVIYLLDKGSFALMLCLCFGFTRSWRRFGLTGGPALAYWPIMLPIWAGTVGAFAHGFEHETAVVTASWVALAICIGFGEEAIFRGVMLDAALGNPPVGSYVAPARARLAIIVSAVIFGAAHLVALAMPGLDYRAVLGEVLFAAGIGLTLGWVRLRTASLWPGIFAHSVLDAVGIVAGGGVSGAMMSNNGADASLWYFSGFTVVWGAVLITFWPAVRPRQL